MIESKDDYLSREEELEVRKESIARIMEGKKERSVEELISSVKTSPLGNFHSPFIGGILGIIFGIIGPVPAFAPLIFLLSGILLLLGIINVVLYLIQ